MALKKIQAFQDEEGKIWKTEQEYKDELVKREAADRERKRMVLVRDITIAVHGTYTGGQLGSLNYPSTTSLEGFLYRLSYEELMLIQPIFEKYRKQINAFKLTV